MPRKNKIGIPQALFHYNDPFFWPVFLENLGFEIIFSPLTNSEILKNGAKVSESEECLSLKVFNGHLNYLKDKTDYVFIPRIKSIKSNYFCCPKFFAIPDLARAFFDEAKIIGPNIDYNINSLKEIAFFTGLYLTKNFSKTLKAYQIAIKHKEEKEKTLIADALNKLKSDKLKKVIIIGHLYNLRDNFINLNIFSRLKNMGVEPIELNLIKDREEEKFFHWNSIDDIIAKIKKLKKGSVSGAIQISAFACGCDSVAGEFIKSELKEKEIPFLFLMIDEHTGEVGFITRLEAFIDTI